MGKGLWGAASQDRLGLDITNSIYYTAFYVKVSKVVYNDN